jgi:iron complex outermembrane recepter protein
MQIKNIYFIFISLYSTLVLAKEPALEEVIVVGQKDTSISIEPRGLAVSLGETHFDATNAANVEDLMKYAPNFFVRKRYIGDANAVPGFRGTHSSQSARSYILVDGFLVSNFLGNSFSFPPKWGLVGPGEVQQFDIVYGPYSTRYPGNSMGGVVSITTRAPEKNTTWLSTQFFSQPYQQYATDNTFNGGSMETGFSLKQGDVLSVRGSYRHFVNEGQPQSWSQLIPSANTTGIEVTGAVVDNKLILQTPIFAAASTDKNRQDQLRLRMDWDFTHWSMQSLLVYWTTDSDTTNPTSYLRDTNGNPVYTGNVNFNNQFWSTTALNLSLTERAEILAGLRISGQINEWELTSNLSHFWLDNAVTKTSNGYSNGVANGAGSLTIVDPSGWWAWDNKLMRRFADHEITLGLTSNFYETDSKTFNTSNWRDADNRQFSIGTQGKSQVLGIFIEDEIRLTDKFSVTPGIRVDQWKAFDGAISRFNTSVMTTQEYAQRKETNTNYSLSSQWHLAPDWLAQLSLATATRFPTVGELFQGKFDSTGVFDPNSFDPHLKPESSEDINVILRKEFSNIRVTGSIFYQDVENFIFSFEHLNPVGARLTSFVNIDRVKQTGAELIFESQDLFVSNLQMDINIAYIDDNIIKNSFLPSSEGNQFPRIPYWRINSQMRYEFLQGWRFATGFRYNSRPNTNLEATQRGDTFGYASEQLIVDTRLSWQFTPSTEWSFGIDNINNDKAWAYHPFNQRTYLLELKWKQ